MSLNQSDLRPGMEVQRSKFSEVGLVHMYIQALALIDVAPTINRHINQGPLFDLPNSSD